MAIGQRIKFFRKRKGMTQKQLGEQLGFLGRTSDVRMAQYESEARIPKHDLVKMMADILDVAPKALTVPDIDTYHGLLHTLFALEDIYGFKISEKEGEICLSLNHSISLPFSEVDAMLQSWQKQSAMLEDGKISREEYDEWRYTYPKLENKQYNNEEPAKTADNPHVYNEIECTMPDIETYYLIDFENVSDAGLTCSNQLGSHDHIHIFSTKNAPKISLESLTAFNNIDFCSHVVPAGKQSLDMHLIAYLGFLIGKNASEKCKYIIISKDNDYDNIISFFKGLTSSIITRQLKIDSESQKTAAAKSAPTADKITASTKKTQLNAEIQHSISASGYDKTVSNAVASITSKHYGSERLCCNVHNELRATYTDYIKIYKIIKPILKKYASDTPPQASLTTQLNAQIQKILSKASFDNKIISYTASLICKHHNEKNAKLTIYKAIVAKYGQKQGLSIYNLIKKSL